MTKEEFEIQKALGLLIDYYVDVGLNSTSGYHYEPYYKSVIVRLDNVPSNINVCDWIYAHYIRQNEAAQSRILIDSSHPDFIFLSERINAKVSESRSVYHLVDLTEEISKSLYQ